MLINRLRQSSVLDSSASSSQKVTATVLPRRPIRSRLRLAVQRGGESVQAGERLCSAAGREGTPAAV